MEEEKIPSKQERRAQILQSIASTSLYPATFESYAPKSSLINKSLAAAAAEKKSGQKKLKLRAIEEDGPGLDDDDIWGTTTAVGTGDGGLFDDYVAVSTGGTTGRPVPTQVQIEEDEDEDDGLFDVGGEEEGSPLFKGKTLSTKPDPPSSPSSSAQSDLFPPAIQPTPYLASKAPNSLEQNVRREKRKEMALLGSLGFSFESDDEEVADPVKKVEVFEEESDESDWAPVMRLRGGAGDDEQMQVDGEDGESESGSSSDDSDSDSDSSSSPSESSSEDESEDGMKVEVDPGQRALTKQETLKDLFKPRADEGAGFSLMAGLDLELDSDEEYESAPLQPTVPEPIPAFIPAPLVTAPVAGKKDLFAPEPGAAFFFYDSHQSMAPPGETFGPDEMRKKWLGTVQTLQGATVEVKPFVKCETDEQMTQKWKDSKVEMTREWKKRHREAVKRVKRGMGSGGAGLGEAAE